MTYIKENGIIYKVITTKTEVNLEALKAEVTDLKAMSEPSDEELIEHGRMMHPYYMDKDRIGSLEAKIVEIEKEVKVIAVVK